jgi:FkbM family methyltransferase
MDVLNGNPEALPEMRKFNENELFKFTTHNRGARIVHQNSFSRDWFQTLFNMIMHVRPLNVQNHDLPSELIVSLTSYPKRFKTLHLTLASLLNQSIKPDRVILWIAHEDVNQLPDSVLNLKKAGLEIRFTKDIKSYKKIIPTLKAFPNAFIATADDDVYYWQTWLEELVDAWKKDMNCVTAHRVHRARISPKGSFEPYDRWNLNFSNDLSPNELNFPTGIAGVFYPPGIFHQDVLKEEIFMEVCPHGDDIWLYWMYRLNGIEVKITGTNRVPLTWPSTQESALWKQNLGNGRNDVQIEKISSKYGVPVKTSSEPIFSVRSRDGNYKMLLPQWKTDHIQRIIANTGRPYEEKMLYDMLNRVKEGDLILDIGANIGNHSLFMASIGNCQVISFEPNKQLAESLHRSIQINKLTNKIEVIQKGLGRANSFAEFDCDISHNLGAQSLSTTDKNGSIEVVTLDSLDIQDKIRMIKIDVEGMELDVLKGSKDTLIEHKPLVYLEAEKQKDFLLLNEFLEKLGYKYQATFNATPTHLFLNRASR